MKNKIFGSLNVLLLEIDPDTSPSGHEIAVGSVSFGAGPGGGDYRHYVLEHDDEKIEWNLWLSIVDEWSEPDDNNDEDAGESKMIYGLQAQASTSERASSEEVAAELLTATWRKEKETSIWGTDFDLFSVDFPGLLTAEQLEGIVADLPE